MPVFQPKIRTIHSYLAGVGASTALLAACLVMFLMLIGVATFDSWPQGGFFQGAGHIKLNAGAAGVPAPPAPSTPNLTTLRAGGPAPLAPASRQRARLPSGGRLAPDKRGHGRGQPGRPPIQTIQPPSPQPPPSPTAGRRNAVQQTVSGVGNAVESDTGALGSDLSQTSPTVGGVVTGAGSTVNDALQMVAGQLGPN